MHEEKQGLIREVTTFIRNAAPPGGIEWAKENEPHKSAIAAAQRRVADDLRPSGALRAYTAAYFRAFGEFVERRYPHQVDVDTVRGMTLAEVWHARARLLSVEIKTDLGALSITPRTQQQGDGVSFSAAEIMLLRRLGVASDLLAEAGLHDAGGREALTRAVFNLKEAFPGAVLEGGVDAFGERHALLPEALS